MPQSGRNDGAANGMKREDDSLTGHERVSRTMMTRRFAKTRFSRAKVGIAAALASMTLAGCGIDSVELNGGIFDAMGISSKAMRANNRERKVAARPGIVMPPDTSRLPPPGSAPAAAAAPQDASWPVGPEDREQLQQAALKRQHDEFCRKAELRKATQGTDAETAMGPLGSCNPGLGEIWFGGKKSAQ
jgi:hypothetical protein